MDFKWPYPNEMDQEERVSTDALVLGSEVVGCYAAIAATRKGKKVVSVEKGATVRSGAAGSDFDHWESTCTNPCPRVTVKEIANAYIGEQDGYSNGIAHYIEYREGWHRLKDMESFGGKIRDTQGEFAGADFRDGKTDLMSAYNYENKFTVRMWGGTSEPALCKELKRLRVVIYDRTETTALLITRENGARHYTGAMGMNVHTAKFLVFSAKTTILAMSRPARIWLFGSDQVRLSGFHPTQSIGGGHTMGYRAGVEFIVMEKSVQGEFPATGRSFPPYSTENSHSTRYVATMVDARGVRIPYTNRDGKGLKAIRERYYPAKGQKFFLRGRVIDNSKYEYRGPKTLEFKELIRRGYQLPFYAGLNRMPDEERRVIWGMMVGEGEKIEIPVLENFIERGFDPAKHRLQPYGTGWQSAAFLAQERQLFRALGGIFHDRDLRTDTQGPYATDDQLYTSDCRGFTAATGYYAGRKVATASSTLELTAPDQAGVNREKEQLYAPLLVEDGMDWRELNKTISKAMQNYYGGVKNDMLLMWGLEPSENYEKEYVPALPCANPHELMCAHEVVDILEMCKLILNACLLRKSSSAPLCFERSDYPQMDPQEDRCFITIYQEDGKICSRRVPKRCYEDVKPQHKACNQDCIKEGAQAYEGG